MKQLIIYADLEYFYILDNFRKFLKTLDYPELTDQEATKLLLKFVVANLFDEKRYYNNFKEWKQEKFNF